MGQKYVAARGQINQGKLIRQNIIDIIDFIVRRKNINPSNKSVFINFVVTNLSCCKRILIRDSQGRKQQRIMERGFYMLKKYFDVSNLMQVMSQSTLMMSALLTKEQKLLLMFQRKQVIEDQPTDFIQSSETDDQDDMSKSFHSALSSSKPFDRIFALGKVSSILKTYEQNNLNNMDKKLVKGFYNRSLNDYKYLKR